MTYLKNYVEEEYTLLFFFYLKVGNLLGHDPEDYPPGSLIC